MGFSLLTEHADDLAGGHEVERPLLPGQSPSCLGTQPANACASASTRVRFQRTHKV